MSSKMTIAIASDLSGFPLKTAVVEYLEGREDVTVMDFGIDDPEKPQPYTAQAPKVASAVQSGKAEKGILICGTGQGMAIVANKHKGVYACVADSGLFRGERSKIINNANVLTMGGWITAPFLGVQIVEAWLSMAFAQKMEFKKDFLAENFALVQKLEEKHFK
jgi:ribose 5-phosphate isomerase B